MLELGWNYFKAVVTRQTSSCFPLEVVSTQKLGYGEFVDNLHRDASAIGTECEEVTIENSNLQNDPGFLPQCPSFIAGVLYPTMGPGGPV
jgi:hypothetical protein